MSPPFKQQQRKQLVLKQGHHGKIFWERIFFADFADFV